MWVYKFQIYRFFLIRVDIFNLKEGTRFICIWKIPG